MRSVTPFNPSVARRQMASLRRRNRELGEALRTMRHALLEARSHSAASTGAILDALKKASPLP